MDAFEGRLYVEWTVKFDEAGKAVISLEFGGASV